MDDSVSRFWDKYIAKTVACNVSDASRRWYVKHVECFIKAHSERRLADLKAADVTKYLEEIGRKPDMPDWRFRQIIDALRILYTEIIRPDWASEFNWGAWIGDARELAPDHATLARIPEVRMNDAKGSSKTSKEGAVREFEQRFPELFERFVAEIRLRDYSIRTEQTYLSWTARFLLFSRFSESNDIHPDRIAHFLEHLAVKRNVAANTQKTALNALVFLTASISTNATRLLTSVKGLVIGRQTPSSARIIKERL
jgi:hypothetical protein